jgi:hypothetical protein
MAHAVTHGLHVTERAKFDERKVQRRVCFGSMPDDITNLNDRQLPEVIPR